ncbi:MAG: DUF2851 family protein [Verrucomicrobiota bacterium]
MRNRYPTVEFSGTHGTVTLSERVLQRIWQQGDFRQQGMQTLEGQRLCVRKPGHWNHQEGPDFQGAEISLDGRVFRGDVEVHFYPQDWLLHGHDRDPNFDRVALHVCLFPPRREGKSVQTASGHWPVTLVLLERLHHDLESYAADEALHALEQRDAAARQELFAEMRLEDRLTFLQERAMQRWRQKAAFARMRLSRASWGAACHRLMLEVLGYRRNRAPMANLAERYPLAAMRGRSSEGLFTEQDGAWKLSGLRPANHPRQRLSQYLKLLEKQPDWPQALLRWVDLLTGHMPETTAAARRRVLKPARDELASGVLAGVFGGSKLDTLVVDAFLPLLSAKTPLSGYLPWFHWPVGDMPEALKGFLRDGGILSRERPACNGWSQGGLELLLESGLS